MPLVRSTLETALRSLSESPGETIADCAKLWADALGDYFAAVVPPSTTAAAAKATLQTALAGAFAAPAAAPLMDTAMTAFAGALGAGMAPAFVAVPPPAPVGWALLFSPPYPNTAASAASKIASRIETWARTGTATPSAGGSPTPWS